MQSYLNILNNIINEGSCKYPTRTIGNVGQVDGSVKTLSLPNVFFEHDMADGFPIVTTRQIPKKSIAVELEGFIHGITDKGWYQTRGCKFWDGWCNPQSLGEDKSLEAQRECPDLGPIYGAQWRDFNGCGYDQLQYIVDTLKNNPYDRRMVCSAWNPAQFNTMALVPCHLMFVVSVQADKLNLLFVMRSCDTFLGLPANIMSYALLLELLSKESNLKPGKLSASIADCHIYENQVEVVYEQIRRTPYKLPRLELPDTIDGKPFSFFGWTHQDFKLLDYKCHPKLTCEVVV